MKELLKAKSEFRKKGVALTADKVKQGAGGSWKFASEDNLIKTIQEPLSDCGLELIVTMDYIKELSTDSIKATLYHIESGENLSSQISLPPVTPRTDKNGNPMYLDAEIERGKQFGYWSRILAIRILGLNDIDPEDTFNVPQDISDDAQIEAVARLDELLEKSKDSDKTIEWVNNRYKTTDYKKLKANQLNEVCNLLISKSNASN